MSKPILLMTRPVAAAERFVATLSPLILAQATVIYAPLIKIIQTQEPPAMTGYHGAIFTSFNGVVFGPLGDGHPAYCVGEKTAERAAAKGWDVRLQARDADGLVKRMIELDQQGPLIHLAGAYRRGEIEKRLGQAGYDVTVHELYTQTPLSFEPSVLKNFSGEATVIVPLFSPRTAAQFRKQAKSATNVRILAMSAAVADALGGARAKCVCIVPEPTASEMRRGVEKLLCGDRLP